MDSKFLTFELCENIEWTYHKSISELLSFSEVVPSMRSLPDNKPVFQINLLDIVATAEPHISKIIAQILSYKENNKFIILEDFIDKFLSVLGLMTDRISSPEITAEKNHIDILIRDTDYAIIIENKIRGANYQRNQLGRYIKSVKDKYGYKDEQIYIVVLPQYALDSLSSLLQSVWKCPVDWRASNNSRKCAVKEFKCWCDTPKYKFTDEETTHCEQCEKDLRERFISRSVMIHSEFADWLAGVNDIISDSEKLLKTAVFQLSDYTKGIYKTRISNKLLMSLTKYIEDRLFKESESASQKWEILVNKIDDISAIKVTMENMLLPLSRELINEWYNELKPQWPNLKYEINKSFSLDVNGVLIGCWSGDDNKKEGCYPYWGFRHGGHYSESQKDMVTAIIDRCQITDELASTYYFAYWHNTEDGAAVCRKFYEAAKELGYLD